MKSRKDALDDAIAATKAAVAEGIVPGGGLALLRCVDAVAKAEATCVATNAPACSACAARSSRRLGRSPRTRLRRRCRGAPHAREQGRGGVRRGARRVRGSLRRWYRRPDKVVRVALENAVSVASVLLLTKPR